MDAATDPHADPAAAPPQAEATPAPHAVTVPAWAIHRRLYDWTLNLAHTKHATWSLAAISFAESSFFPIPPDALLAPLCMGNRSKAWWFGFVCTFASVAGAVLGYFIGWGFWEAFEGFAYAYIPGFSEEKFLKVEAWYAEHGAWILFVAAFTPIPFKIFTVAGGALAQPLLPFLIAATIGRGARFFLVAGLFRWAGPKAQPFIDKWFNLLCVLAVLLLVGGFAALKLLH